MEITGELNPQQRRAQVASWIQGCVRPVANALEPNLTDIDEEIIEEVTDFEVREYQLDAWANVWEGRQSGEKSALIHMATGLGKTSVAVFDYLKFREEFRAEHGRDPRALFVSHRHELNDQAAERFAAFIPDAEQGSLDEGPFGDITFGTTQYLYKNLNKFDPEEFDYIIYDEAHHNQAETFKEVVQHFKPAYQLALTATPDRTDRKDIRELFGDEKYSKGLAEAMAEGWLAEPDYHIVFDEAVKSAMESGFEADSLKALAELFSVAPRNEVIAKNIKDEMSRIGLEFGQVKTIVFCQSIEHADEMAELLEGASYHSEELKEVRKDILDDFRHGDLQVICAVDMLNEGIDVPDARLLVFLRSTSSNVVFEQQFGRGARKYHGKERFSVLDFVANIERMAMIMELANEVRNLRERMTDETGRQPDGHSGGGLQIHTGHGEFDFDRMVVDILDKFETFRNKLTLSSKLNELSNEELVSIALELSPDKPLEQRTIKELSKQRLFPSNVAITAKFGSLVEFQRACGFEVRYSKGMSDEDIVQLALQLSPDKPLTAPNVNKLSKAGALPSASTLSKRFGSLVEFQRACGFEVKEVSKMSEEEIVELGLEFSPDKPLTAKKINALSKQGLFPSATYVARMFGNIVEFQKACGFEEQAFVFRDMSNHEIVSLALELSPDEPLTQKRIKDLSRDGQFISNATIAKRFGSLVDLQKACGFDVRERSNLSELSNQELVSLALELSPGKPLTGRSMIKLSKKREFVSMAHVVRRFGSIAEFQKQCGFNE